MKRLFIKKFSFFTFRHYCKEVKSLIDLFENIEKVNGYNKSIVNKKK